MNFELLNQAETHIVKIANTHTTKIECIVFVNNTGQALHVEADNVHIKNSMFTRNDGGVVDIQSKNALINNTEFNYKSTESGRAVEMVSGTVVITWCNFINNKAFQFGGAIGIGSVSISDSVLKNNGAYELGGTISVSSSSVSISSSTLTNNIADHGGGAIYVSSGSVSISDSTLINNRADYGGAIYASSSSSVSISNSVLANNGANSSGGAIYISSSSVVSITNSVLTNNRAVFGGTIYVFSSSVSISCSTLTNNIADHSGGVIHVYRGSVSISGSTLTNNRADYGGAIYISSSSVSIFNSMLANNGANSSSGAIYVSSNSVVSITNSVLTNNSADIGGTIYISSSSASISNSTLTNNRADSGGAIGVYLSNVSFSDSMLTNNSADHGGAIDIFNSRVKFNGPTRLSNNRGGVLGGAIKAVQSEMYINTERTIITNNTATSGGGIFLGESTLFITKPIEIYHNTAHQDGGGIYAYSSKVEFRSNKQSEIVDNIAENNGGGIYAAATTIKLTQSYVNIDSNTAKAKGGGVYLQQSSKLYLFKEVFEYLANSSNYQLLYVKLMINNNSAQHGGGIFVADDTESGTCRGEGTESRQTIFVDCFIQTINLYGIGNNPNYFNTFMTNNTATQSGADIYGGLLDRCTVSKFAEYHISSNGPGLNYINNIVKSPSELSISLRPVKVIFCNNGSISTRKGHLFKISIMAVDQVGNPMNATIRSSVVSENGFDRLNEGQEKQTVGNQCTELEYNVFSQDNSAQVELYAEGPCINLGISRQLINISFLPCTCPIGLKPTRSDTECKCDCDPFLQQGYPITNCSEKNGTITLESNTNIWIEFINTTNGTYVISNCTFDYCVEKPVNISLSNPDEQCAYNRSGVLCGECKPGLSLVLATSNCIECSDLYLLLLIPFALAGILLVALILVLNITIATGNIHGLIFYANIVAANTAIFFPNLNNFLTVFVSWVNLDMGIETCFYNGMNSQAKVLLQLVFPAYVFLLMFLVIILSKYFNSFAKLLSNRNPVAALGTLVLATLLFQILAFYHCCTTTQGLRLS
ncbi:probable outer membrane protein pmp20 [Halichondria panicea]|uniref:probable outer membrane protein pmp20 n=1 Tax=Halichondria panicea TaxID=6063 RepID=UPI00312B85DA